MPAEIRWVRDRRPGVTAPPYAKMSATREELSVSRRGICLQVRSPMV